MLNLFMERNVYIKDLSTLAKSFNKIPIQTFTNIFRVHWIILEIVGLNIISCDQVNLLKTKLNIRKNIRLTKIFLQLFIFIL